MSAGTWAYLLTSNSVFKSNSLKKIESGVHWEWDWACKPRVDASSSSVAVSIHKSLLRGLVNADRMTSAVPNTEQAVMR